MRLEQVSEIMKKHEKNDDAILVRMPKELREKAERIAEEQERPLPWIVRKLLEKWIEEESRKNGTERSS